MDAMLPLPPHPPPHPPRPLYTLTNAPAPSQVGLSWCWPYILYYLVYASAVTFFIVTAALRWYLPQQLLLNAASVLWGSLICISFWPPLAALLPRKQEEQGWKILWKPISGPFRIPRDAAAGGRQGSSGGRDADSSPKDLSSEKFPAFYPPGEGGVDQAKKGRQQAPLGVVDAKDFAKGGKASAAELQHSVMSVPSFEQRQRPQRTLAFQLISVAMVVCLVVAAVMDYLVTNKKV
jgi:hypothetical protein